MINDTNKIKKKLDSTGSIALHMKMGYIILWISSYKNDKYRIVAGAIIHNDHIISRFHCLFIITVAILIYLT